jgi:hypothetical protein
LRRFCVVLTLALLSAGCSRTPSAPASEDAAASKPAVQSSSASEQLAEAARPAMPANAARNSRPIYPFSLVPGGVYSAEELRSAMSVSKELRAHYSDFDLGHVQLVREKENIPAYVSYRRNGQIFWTKHPLMLHAGELVLTDGHYIVRARCANQISMVPREPVEVSPEKVENHLETAAPEAPVDYAKLEPLNSALFPITGAVPLGPPVAGFPPTGVVVTGTAPLPPGPIIPITPVCTTCGQTPTPPPVPVPEPGSAVLAGVSLVLLSGALALRERRRRVADKR